MNKIIKLFIVYFIIYGSHAFAYEDKLDLNAISRASSTNAIDGYKNRQNINKNSIYKAKVSNQRVNLKVKKYSIFSDQGDHLKELIKNGKLKEASELFNIYEGDYFLDKPFLGDKTPFEKFKKELGIVAENLNQEYNKDISSLIEAINKSIQLKNSGKVIEKKWEHFKLLIQLGASIKNVYNSNRILTYSEFRSPFIKRLDKSVNRFESELRVIASEEFKKYDLSNSESFFSKYPVEVYDKSSLLSGNASFIVDYLEKIDIGQAVNLIKKYNLKSIDGINQELVRVFLDKAAKKVYGDKKPPLRDVLSTLKQIQGIGVNVSDTLPKSYETMFIHLDGMSGKETVVNQIRPFAKSNIENINDKGGAYLIILDSREVDIQRKAGDEESVLSEYASGFSSVINPEYLEAQSAYNLAVNKFNNTISAYKEVMQMMRNDERERRQQQSFNSQMLAMQNSSFNCDTNYYGGYSSNTNCSYGITPGRGQVVAAGNAGSALGMALGSLFQGESDTDFMDKELEKARRAKERAKSRLNRIPKEIDKAYYQKYSFTKTPVTITKNYKYKVYFITKAEQQYSVETIPLQVTKSFELAKDLHQDDSNYDANSFSGEKDIDSYSSTSSAISLEDLISNLPKKYTSNSYTNLVSLLKDVRSAYKKEVVTPIVNESKVVVIKDTKKVEKIKGNDNYINDLRNIKELLDSGIINQDDFKTMKKKIIDRL